MDKPTKPSENLANSFGGLKSNFSQSQITNGYEPDVRDVLGGKNLNYLLDTLGKRQTYWDTIVDFINALPVGKIITTDSNNKLVYDELGRYGKRSIGETIFSLLPLNSSDLHLLDGTLLLSTGIYSDFCDYIADLYNGGTCSNCFCTEADWQASVTTYGVCGKFVYDSLSGTVRLPKVTGIVEGTIDINTLTDVVAAGLPSINHTHSVNINTGLNSANHVHSGTTGGMDRNEVHSHTYGRMEFSSAAAAPGQTGFLTKSGSGTTDSTNIGHLHGFTTGENNVGHTHNVSGNTSQGSSVSSIYGNNGTVQPQTIKGFYYIVVANIIPSDYNVDIDEVTTDLGNKVDKTGDTMTGNLTINNNLPLYIGKSTLLDKTSTTTPSGSGISGAILQTLDKNGNYVSNFFTSHDTINNFAMGMTLDRSINAVTTTANLGVGINSTGDEFAFASTGVKQSITNWSFPSSTYTDFTLGATGSTYTAPADGWFVCGISDNGYMELINLSSGGARVASTASSSGGWARASVQAKKGDTLQTFYNSSQVEYFSFVNAVGG